MKIFSARSSRSLRKARLARLAREHQGSTQLCGPIFPGGACGAAGAGGVAGSLGRCEKMYTARDVPGLQSWGKVGTILLVQCWK